VVYSLNTNTESWTKHLARFFVVGEGKMGDYDDELDTFITPAAVVYPPQKETQKNRKKKGAAGSSLFSPGANDNRVEFSQDIWRVVLKYINCAA